MKKQESSEEMVREGEKKSTSTLPRSSEVGDMDDDDNVLPMKKRKRSRKIARQFRRRGGGG